MEKEDKELGCVDCGRNFSFSAGEQQYYEDRGLLWPKRCKSCRMKKKIAREQQQPNQ
jgi:hypothetical protein